MSIVEPVRRQTPSAKLAQGGGPNILISLDAIRQEAGQRWEKLRETIYARLEALLRLRLSPTDFFLPIDDVSYLVSMPKATAEDAQVSCLRIAYELHSSLLGPCAMQQLQIANAFNVGNDILELTPIVSHQLTRLAERAQILDLLVSKDGAPAPRKAAPAESAPFAAPPAKPRLPDVPRYEFLPIWDVQKEVIWAYRCNQIVPASVMTADTPSAKAREAVRLALGTLRRSAMAIEEHQARGERFLLIVPVRYETLTTPVARMEFVSACRQLPCELRPYLVFEISEMPVGVPHSRLIELVGSFQSFSRGVIAHVPISCPRQADYEGTGLIGLGFSLPSTARQIPQMETGRLCTVGKRLAVSTFLGNVTNLEVAREAINSGVAWLSGPVIAPVLQEPKSMSRLPRANVLQGGSGTPPMQASNSRW